MEMRIEQGRRGETNQKKVIKRRYPTRGGDIKFNDFASQAMKTEGIRSANPDA